MKKITFLTILLGFCLITPAMSQTGSTCEDPIVITSLPYTVSDDTANYGDNYNPSTDSSPQCSTTTYGNNYHGGNDVVYSYTATANTTINVRLQGVVGWTAIFIYSDCANIGIEYEACSTATTAGNREINNFTVTAGETYYFLASSWPAPQTFTYTLNVTDNDPCAGTSAPVGDSEQDLDLGQTLADLDVTGENLTWYSDEGLTNEVPDTTEAEDGMVYYVTQTVGDCVSNALAITVTVTDPCAGVLLPEGNASQDLDLGQTLADLDVTGENLTWYSDDDLTDEIPDTTQAVNGTVYYVTQTVGNCVSEALSIMVTVTDSCEGTVSPVGEENQDYIEGETLADLDVTGENLMWYSDEELTLQLDESALLENGETYYVIQTVDGCVSPYLAVTVNQVLSTGQFDNNAFNYHPNPVSDKFYLSYSKEIKTVTVFNTLGQQVLHKAINSAEASMDFSNYSKGSYFIKVQAENGEKMIKIIKQ